MTTMGFNKLDKYEWILDKNKSQYDIKIGYFGDGIGINQYYDSIHIRDIEQAKELHTILGKLINEKQN
jgi:hypothetical protein